MKYFFVLHFIYLVNCLKSITGRFHRIDEVRLLLLSTLSWAELIDRLMHIVHCTPLLSRWSYIVWCSVIRWEFSCHCLGGVGFFLVWQRKLFVLWVWLLGVIGGTACILLRCINLFHLLRRFFNDKDRGNYVEDGKISLLLM